MAIDEPDKEKMLIEKYRNAGMLTPGGELWLSQADALRYIDDCQKMGVAISGMNFLKNVDDNFMLVPWPAVFEDAFSTPDPVSESTTAARRLIEKGLPYEADWVSFTLVY